MLAAVANDDEVLSRFYLAPALRTHPALRWLVETNRPLLCAQLRLAMAKCVLQAARGPTNGLASVATDLVVKIGENISPKAVIAAAMIKYNYWGGEAPATTPLAKRRRVMR